jgi:hypothetical protein
MGFEKSLKSLIIEIGVAVARRHVTSFVLRAWVFTFACVRIGVELVSNWCVRIDV